MSKGNKVAGVLDRYRFVIGLSAVFNPPQYSYEDNYKSEEYLLSMPLGLKVRFFSASRKARNKFALEIGAVMNPVYSKPATNDIGIEVGAIYKFNKFAGAGIVGGPYRGSTEYRGENVILPFLKAGVEVHLLYDVLRLGAGNVFSNSNSNTASPYFQVLFEMGALSTIRW